MSFDLTGLNPKSPAGLAFYRPNVGWHPIALWLEMLGPEEACEQIRQAEWRRIAGPVPVPDVPDHPPPGPRLKRNVPTPAAICWNSNDQDVLPGDACVVLAAWIREQLAAGVPDGSAVLDYVALADLEEFAGFLEDCGGVVIL